MTRTITIGTNTALSRSSPSSSKMALSVRHARYTIGMAAGVLCLLLLFASYLRPPKYISQSSGTKTAAHPSPPAPSPKHILTPIQAKLEHQEDVYYEIVQNRHALIRKVGPTPEKLQPFPDPRYRAKYLLWDFFPASFNCPYETERIGVLGDGGKWMCGLSQLKKKANCVVYSAGISSDSSFEAELVRRTGCEVFGFDYSVTRFGPEVENFTSIRNKTHFYPIGISGSDDHGAKPPMWTIQALMQKHGHTFIDILKLDIEGSEFEALKSMVKYYKDNGPLPFGQLQIEIHANKISFVQFLKWWEDLEEAGLRPFWTEPNLLYSHWLRTAPALAEYSFLNIGTRHAIVDG